MVPPSQRPNVLLITTDQQRHDALGALHGGGFRTPTFDRLAREGVTFTHATTPSPVCMPARWSLYSGQWTTTHRCYSNHHAGRRPPTSLPELLRAAGYRTALVGKNHSFLQPADLDVFEDHPSPAAAGPERAAWIRQARERNPRLIDEPVPGGPETDPERGVTEAALRFLDSASGASEAPFFLHVSYLHPHTPYMAPDPFFSEFAEAPVPDPLVEPDGLAAAGKPFRHRFHQANNDAILPFTPEQTQRMGRVYRAMVAHVDAEIALVLDHLDTLGLAAGTLVIFTSDHGDYQGDHALFTKSSALYDCLVRVPFIVRWPGQIDAGRTDRRSASLVDVLPTVASAAGLPIPAQAQGISLLTALRDGGNGRPIRDAAFSEYGTPGAPYDAARLERENLRPGDFSNPGQKRVPWEGNPVSLAGRIRMVRTHEWKYVAEEGGTCELYDLTADPGELINLWNHPAHTAIQRELEAVLSTWKQSLPGVEADHTPVPMTIGVGPIRESREPALATATTSLAR